MHKSFISCALVVLALAAAARADLIWPNLLSSSLTSDLESAMKGLMPAGTEPLQVDRVLTFVDVQPDSNKDGFVDNQMEGQVDPTGYEVLHCRSLWGNVRITLGQPFYHLPQSLSFDDIGGASASASPASVPRTPISSVPEPACLTLLVAGACAMLRKR